MFRKVLVGVDGEQGGRDAVALAARLADGKARTWLVNVFGAGAAVTVPAYGSAAAVVSVVPFTEVIFCDATVHPDGTDTVPSPTVTA